MATGSGTGTESSASTEPVTRAECKTHMRIDHTNEDSYIDLLITAARKKAEQYTRRKFIQATLTGYLDVWPDSDYITLPFGNLSSVTSVKYTNTAGTQSTFSSDDYIVESAVEPGKIVLGYGEVWPTAQLYPSLPIEIIFVAGYGDNANDVPDMIKHAIKFAVADLYENREDYLITNIALSAKILGFFQGLLFPYKFWPLSDVKVLQT